MKSNKVLRKSLSLVFVLGAVALAGAACDGDDSDEIKATDDAVEQRGGGGAGGSAGQAPQGGQVAAGAGGASAGAGGARAGMQGATAGHAGGAATNAGGASAGGGGDGDAGHAQAGQGGVAGASEGGAGGQSAGGGAAAGAGGDVGKGGDGGAGGDVGKAGGGQGGAPVGCKEGRPGPKMVRVPAFDGSSYCIDSTEVTQAQYAEFVAALVPLDSQPKECAFNVRFKPTEDLVPDPDTPTEMGECPWGFYRPDEHGDAAMGCVDWCDAHMFCQWAGKRLCGIVGGTTIPPEVVEDETKGNLLENEWYSACSQLGTTKYAYGNEYNKETCGTDSATTEAIKVDGVCRGGKPPFDQVQGMSGGRHEWLNGCAVRTDSADGSPYLVCGWSPGAHQQALYTECGHLNRRNINATDSSTGFRCCAGD